MKFDLQELESFLAVASTRNFTQAAAETHVTQPALSLKIQEMEKRLGTPLLERTTRKVRLTQAGEVLKRYATAILETCEEAEQAVQHCSAGEKHTLELGYGSRAQFEYLLKLIHILHAEHPEIQINATHGITFEQLYLGQLDAALMMEQSLAGQTWADYLLLDDCGLSVYFPKGCFPDGMTDISVLNLAGQEFIIPEKHVSERGVRFTSLHEMIVRALTGLGLSEDTIHTGSDSQAFCSRILSEHRLGIMPDSSRIVTGELIGCLPLRECRSGFGIALAWNRTDNEHRNILALKSAATGIIEAMPKNA